MNFLNKTIIITGSGSGLGRHLALLLADEDAYVACAGYNENANKETGDLLKNKNARYSLHHVDISKSDQIQDFVRNVTNQYGSIDVLINNAGIMQSFTKFSDLTLEQAKGIIDVINTATK